MNAKTCERLRGAARAKTVGMPSRGYIEVKQALGSLKASPGRMFTFGLANYPQTTRGVYRALKRNHLTGASL